VRNQAFLHNEIIRKTLRQFGPFHYYLNFIAMLSHSRLLGLVLVAQAAYDLPVETRTPYAVKETHRVPKRWSHSGFPAPDHVIRLQIASRQQNFNVLEAIYTKV
jgi:hypothetical protein